MATIAKSEYAQIVKNRKRGRRPLSTVEKEQRKAENRRRVEAKRRAQIVIAHRYSDEFEKVYENEYLNLAGDKRYDATLHAS